MATAPICHTLVRGFPCHRKSGHEGAHRTAMRHGPNCHCEVGRGPRDCNDSRPQQYINEQEQAEQAKAKNEPSPMVTLAARFTIHHQLDMQQRMLASLRMVLVASERNRSNLIAQLAATDKEIDAIKLAIDGASKMVPR